MKESIACVMPAYRPDVNLAERVAALQAVGFSTVVVVDDGSGAEFEDRFTAAAQVAGCKVLRHSVNKGKGAALKTAFTYVFEECPDVFGVITVDADGQHAPEDCVRVSQALVASPESIVMGVRDFRLSRIPFRSWWGNTWTILLFVILYGKYIPDTQTGLRAYARKWLPRLAAAPGSGYEYEMATLCRAARTGADFRFVSIRTIYEDGNSSSHFSPLRDTLRIYRMLFGNLFSRL